MPTVLLLVLACADDPPRPVSDDRVATSWVEAACTVTDAWVDHDGAVASEAQRGFDVDGRPIWHQVDGVLERSWSYDADGRPLTMQQGDPLDPEVEHIYHWDDEGLLERVDVDGSEVLLTWGEHGLLVRGVTDAEGRLVQSTRWIYDDDGSLLQWSVERDGFRVREGVRETSDDGLSYLEVQTELPSGAWLEMAESFFDDGTPATRSLTTETIQSTRAWERVDGGWRLSTSYSTNPYDSLDDEVVYTFDALGREVSREVSGEGASPFVRRDRTWDCEGPVEEPFEAPLYAERSIFYVSPLYVDPPSP